MNQDRPTDAEAPEDTSPADAREDTSPAEAAARSTGAGTGGGGSGSPNPDGAAPSAESRDAAEQLEDLQAEMEALNDRHLRLAAEFDNYRKRITREREDLGKRAGAELVANLLDGLDDLHRVAEYDAGSTSIEALLEGVELVEKKLRGALEAAGLETIDARGHLFNPESMEALMTVETEDPAEDDMVDEVFQKGYRFRGMLVRPARVRVKKHG